jgi:putative tryptophan/tyrosine transport system substrate-binding protein
LRIRRREFVVAAALIAFRPARAEEQSRPLVAVLIPGRAAETNIGALRAGLAELGYVDGQNIGFAVRSADSDNARLSALAAELIALKPAVIVTNGAPAIRAVKQLAGTTPIVMAVVDDVVALGFAQSLAHPGGNLTGLSIVSKEVLGKRLEMLHAVIKEPDCVGGLSIATNIDPGAELELATAARTLGITLTPISIRNIDELSAAFDELTRQRCRSVIVFSDPLFVAVRRELVDLAARHYIAASYDNKLIVHVGGLMSYGPDTTDMFRRSATYVDQILKGAKPADLPIQRPTRFELVLNLRTANALGLTIPQSLLLLADEVIE